MATNSCLLVVLLTVFLATTFSEAQTIPRKYGGKVRTEVVANVSSAAVWALYRSHDFPRLIVQLMPTTFQDINYVSGDGSVGTLLRLIPQPGDFKGIRVLNITMLDDETQTIVFTQVEGGLLDTGFTKFETTYKVIEKKNNFCMIRTTVAYNVKAGSENLSANIVPNWEMEEAIINHVVQQQQHNSNHLSNNSNENDVGSKQMFMFVNNQRIISILLFLSLYCNFLT